MKGPWERLAEAHGVKRPRSKLTSRDIRALTKFVLFLGLLGYLIHDSNYGAIPFAFLLLFLSR